MNVSVYRKLKCYLTSSTAIPKPGGAVELACSAHTFVSYFFPTTKRALEKEEFVAITVCSRDVNVLLHWRVQLRLKHFALGNNQCDLLHNREF